MKLPVKMPVKCLLVDDLDDNLLTMSALLRSDGVEVLTARSGREALELLLVHDVALALLDVQMPEMDGFELAELMRSSERTRHVPLIFVTAGARETQRLFKGYDAGAVDFLFKPIEPWILQSKAQVFFDLYRSRQQLAQELDERTETLRLNEIFAAVLAHDLRDPLNAMLTAAMLIDRQAESDAIRRSAGRIVASGRSMSRMIGDMLDLARARLAGGIPVQCEPAELGRVAQRVVDEQRAAHPDREFVLQAEGPLTGAWDEDRLAQALANLVGNALVHGERGRPITLRLDGRAADTVAVSVDNAGSIPPELLPHIFDPFRGSARPRESRAGLGLGLYIVDQIAQAHGGRVEACSADGHTCFTLTLPRRSG
ncbi:ATP-binding protein [Ideonella sp.]|uniref:hybrid sensor histidine kinase/response regulator n=1 Tax=Ideonella sp. TaxID=1929293 RepID=UPI0035B181D3